MKTILFFLPCLNIGGIERVFITYANCLSTSYNVRIVTCHTSGDLEKYLSPKINVYSFNCSLKLSLFKLAKYLRINDIDVLMTGGDMPNAYAILANFLSSNKTKVVISQHNYLNIEQYKLLSSVIYRTLYRHSFKIIAVSEGIKRFLVNNKIPECKIITLYNPINIENIFELSNHNSVIEDNYLLYVGRLSKVKNLFFLIDVFEIVKENDKDIKLIIIGDGDQKFELEEYSNKSIFSDDIIFKGMLSNPFPYINSCKLVVLTSFSEALPTIILESFALGKKVVSTPTEGARELIKNSSLGYISSSYDILEFSQLINKALLDKDRIDSNESDIDSYSVDNVSQTLIGVFQID
jgi:glycosyltransferase involved in cell wall biosynthesis